MKETDKECLTLIQLLTKYLDAEEIRIEALKNLRAAIKEKEEKPVVAKTEEERFVVKLEHEEKKPTLNQLQKYRHLRKVQPSHRSERSSKYQGRLEICVKKIA